MSQTKKEEKTLLAKFTVDEILKNPDVLYESIALFRYIVITDGDYQVMVNNSEIAYVEVANESPYIIINLKNGKSVEIGWGEE